jgi:hypothetical protein
MVTKTEIATVEFSETAEVTDYELLLDDTIDNKEWFETESNEDGSYTVYKLD